MGFVRELDGGQKEKIESKVLVLLVNMRFDSEDWMSMLFENADGKLFS